MPPDYNLVIIGGTAAARYAALTASRLKARVALVEPEFLGNQILRHQTLVHVGRVAQQMRQVEQWGLPGGNFDAPVQWSASLQWAQWVTEVQDEGERSLPILAASGVDVIVGTGEFIRRPHLAFGVNGRSLRSRTYLIATASCPVIPNIDGLDTAQPCTPETFWLTPPPSPAHIVILGGTPSGLELAQTLVRFGYQVTLIVKTLLPHEDAEVAHLMQAHLESEGVQILSQTQVTQVKQLDDKKWVQAGDRALEADEIIVATQQPQLDSLNLEAAGVKFTAKGIPVNNRLQTSNSRIYACGEALGGYPFPHLGQYEAAIALKNALFFSSTKTDYRTIPWAIFTNPELARVGLTEAQVIQQFGKDQFDKNVIVLRQTFKMLAKAQICGATTGFCKLIVHRNGKILGAHLIGANVSEIVGVIALAIRQNLHVKALATLPTISPTWSEIVQRTAMEWEKKWGDRHPFQQNLLESWFNFRR
ncbi:NAD(P)/FAD-dependent oxidoreductase [Cyanobacteria bacterium FACHB-471]|nr:NAD(P)/FAD-dependent oxidoreductase [Cyanobacteria bacterium FACHB-471]